jgi:hypothetical protein
MNAPPLVLFTKDPLATAAKSWLVKGVLGAAEVSMFLGPPFVGKSAVVGDAAATIGTGEPWFGHQTEKSATLYVAQERAPVMLRRLRAYEVYHEVKNLPVGMLFDRLHLVDEGKAAADRIARAVADCEDRTGLKVRLITLDTVAALSPGADENSPRDMGRFVDSVARIRDVTGAHISLVHHTPLDDGRKARGHSSLSGMVDTIILVTAKGAERSWFVHQANDLAEKPAAARFELQSVSIGRDGTTAPVVVPAAMAQSEKATSLIAIIAGNPNGILRADVVRAAGALDENSGKGPDAVRKSVERQIAQLVETGTLKIDGERKNAMVRLANGQT